MKSIKSFFATFRPAMALNAVLSTFLFLAVLSCSERTRSVGEENQSGPWGQNDVIQTLTYRDHSPWSCTLGSGAAYFTEFEFTGMVMCGYPYVENCRRMRGFVYSDEAHLNSNIFQAHFTFHLPTTHLPGKCYPIAREPRIQPGKMYIVSGRTPSEISGEVIIQGCEFRLATDEESRRVGYY